MTKAYFVVFIRRLWNNVHHRWITNNFPCKWHTSITSGSKSSPRKIFRRNSSGARTSTSNSVWTTKEKTWTRNRGAKRTSLSTAKATPTTIDKETKEQENGISEALWSFYTVENPNLLFFRFPRWSTKARSIVIFMRTAMPHLCFVFVFF